MIDHYFQCTAKNHKDLVYDLKFTKDQNFQLKKGTLALSHQGVCLIDNLELAPKAFTSIASVIDREKLAVQKKAISEEFDVKTTIIASAEPKNLKIK